MSVVFSRDPDRPGLHALVIGVGRYPHAGTGSVHTSLRRLGDLGAPPHSAAAIARLLVEFFIEGEAFPLRSLQILTSDPVGVEGWTPPELAAGWTPSVPTFQNIRDAFDQLWTWGDRHSSNALLVFFSGHGVQRTDWTLFSADVGRNATDALRGAIDISETRRGTYRCAARTQLWLVDACRENPSAFAAISDVSGEPLARAQAVDTSGLDSTFIASTTDYALSWGEKKAPSRFAKGMVAALGGLAAHPEDGRWVISTGGIQKAVNAVLRRQIEDNPGWPIQQCELLGGTGTHILLNNASPRVPTRVTCDPADYLPSVELTIHDVENGAELARRVGSHHDPWRVDVSAGLRRISAAPTAAHVSPKEKLAFIGTPEAVETLKW